MLNRELGNADEPEGVDFEHISWPRCLYKVTTRLGKWMGTVWRSGKIGCGEVAEIWGPARARQRIGVWLGAEGVASHPVRDNGSIAPGGRRRLMLPYDA